MKKPNTPSKWNPNDKSRLTLVSVPAPAVVEPPGSNGVTTPAQNDDGKPSQSAPAEDRGHSER